MVDPDTAAKYLDTRKIVYCQVCTALVFVDEPSISKAPFAVLVPFQVDINYSPVLGKCRQNIALIHITRNITEINIWRPSIVLVPAGPFQLTLIPCVLMQNLLNRVYPLHTLPRTWKVSSPHPVTGKQGYFLSLVKDTELQRVRLDPVFKLPLSFLAWIEKQNYDLGDGILPDHFLEWGPFLEYLHGALIPRCLEASLTSDILHEWKGRARLLPAYTWMNLADERAGGSFGSTPLPEDILGVVQLDAENNFVPRTYQRLFTHRLISLYGRFRLPRSLQEEMERDLCS